MRLSAKAYEFVFFCARHLISTSNVFWRQPYQCYRYVEQNKRDGGEFPSTVGAEIIFCPELEKWVFTHKDIVKNLSTKIQDEVRWHFTKVQFDSFRQLSCVLQP